MLFLFLLVGAAIIARCLWRAMGTEQASSDRPSSPRRATPARCPARPAAACQRPGRRPGVPASARREGRAATTTPRARDAGHSDRSRQVGLAG